MNPEQVYDIILEMGEIFCWKSFLKQRKHCELLVQLNNPQVIKPTLYYAISFIQKTPL